MVALSGRGSPGSLTPTQPSTLPSMPSPTPPLAYAAPFNSTRRELNVRGGGGGGGGVGRLPRLGAFFTRSAAPPSGFGGSGLAAASTTCCGRSSVSSCASDATTARIGVMPSSRIVTPVVHAEIAALSTGSSSFAPWAKATATAHSSRTASAACCFRWRRARRSLRQRSRCSRRRVARWLRRSASRSALSAMCLASGPSSSHRGSHVSHSDFHPCHLTRQRSIGPACWRASLHTSRTSTSTTRSTSHVSSMCQRRL